MPLDTNLSVDKFLPAMARPANADADATRRHILTAATAAFGQHGLDGCTVREIATAAGVTFAAVHHYFGTKDELYATCLDQAFAELSAIGAEIAGVVARSKCPVQDAVRHAFRAARAKPDRSRFLLRAFVYESSPIAQDRVRKAQRMLLGSATELLAPRDYGKRIPLVGIGILITRFAVAPKSELSLFAEETGDANAAIEAYLVDVATHTLEAA
ncbi:MAG: TetR/AcrR family transcriptional regulator [Myxococcales bacterium]|nr:TetR/AcrR family transcriptional regulator [Myxococcales bacterium]